MNNTTIEPEAPAGVDQETGTAEGNGVFAELGALPPGAIVTEDALARIFRRHPASVKRAIERGEFPPPARLFGGNTWTAGVIVRHIEKRLEEAAKETERKARILQKHLP